MANHYTQQISYFPKQGLHIVTQLEPNGDYSAIADEVYDDPSSAMGWGNTRLEAIADLRDQLVERGLIEP